MKSNQFWAAVSKALAVMTVTLIMALMLAPGAWAASTYKTLHAFRMSSGGQAPSGNLVSDAAGNLYGTTTGGGLSSGGVVFKLTHNSDGSWTEHVLHSFTNGADGGNPLYAGVILDAAGNLYGATYKGGSSSCGGGGGFKLAPNPDGTWTEHVLHRFTGGNDGGEPFAAVILDAAGNLYGTTQLGGKYGGSSCGCGVVFKLAPNPDGTWTEHVLHTFTGGADGGFPWAGVILGAAGNLYGTTNSGGSSDVGVVFKLAPNPDGTWTEHVLHAFLGYGANPIAGLLRGASGNLYGTAAGGTSHGLVFEIKP